MFLMKYKNSVEKLIEAPADKTVHKTKEKKESPKKSKVKNDSNIFFEMNKTKDNITEEKKVSKQPEHLRLALEARRARLAEEKKQGIKPKKKQKQKQEESDSDSSLDINKLKMKNTPKKYFSDTDTGSE
jgi:hypothetical protein